MLDSTRSAIMEDLHRDPHPATAYCYRVQAWIIAGRVDGPCGHPASMRPHCCYAGLHAGEPHPVDCPDCH